MLKFVGCDNVIIFITFLKNIFSPDNAVYDQPDIQQGAHLDASTYEIPINTVLRTGQPKQPQMGGGEDPALYSTVAGSDAEFLDSFESEYNVTSHNVATTRQEHPQVCHKMASK